MPVKPPPRPAKKTLDFGPVWTLDLEKTIYVPPDAWPEGPQVALAGRSNVGKSSLINALGDRKRLAKISSNPGKTRSINFYKIRSKDDADGATLVDLPGFGFAARSKTEREAWRKLIEDYLTRAHPTCIAHLVDSRHPPQKLDLELAGYAQSMNIPRLTVLTKADKTSQNDLGARVREWSALSNGAPIPTSAETGRGLAALKHALAGFFARD